MRVITFKFFYIFNNMDNIIEPTENFDFTKLSLAHPSGIQGGAYFTKIEYNKKPLYIQTCKSQTRQGFVKTGKKYYCDLMFDNNSETLINWFENLEERCQKLIFENRDTWFQSSLEENDLNNLNDNEEDLEELNLGEELNINFNVEHKKNNINDNNNSKINKTIDKSMTLNSDEGNV